MLPSSSQTLSRSITRDAQDTPSSLPTASTTRFRTAISLKGPGASDEQCRPSNDNPTSSTVYHRSSTVECVVSTTSPLPSTSNAGTSDMGLFVGCRFALDPYRSKTTVSRTAIFPNSATIPRMSMNRKQQSGSQPQQR